MPTTPFEDLLLGSEFLPVITCIRTRLLPGFLSSASNKQHCFLAPNEADVSQTYRNSNSIRDCEPVTSEEASVASKIEESHQSVCAIESFVSKRIRDKQFSDRGCWDNISRESTSEYIDIPQISSSAQTAESFSRDSLGHSKSAQSNSKSRNLFLTTTFRIALLQCRKCGASFLEAEAALSHFKLHLLVAYKRCFFIVKGQNCAKSPQCFNSKHAAELQADSLSRIPDQKITSTEREEVSVSGLFVTSVISRPSIVTSLCTPILSTAPASEISDSKFTVQVKTDKPAPETLSNSVPLESTSTKSSLVCVEQSNELVVKTNRRDSSFSISEETVTKSVKKIRNRKPLKRKLYKRALSNKKKFVRRNRTNYKWNKSLIIDPSENNNPYNTSITVDKPCYKPLDDLCTASLDCERTVGSTVLQETCESSENKPSVCDKVNIELHSLKLESGVVETAGGSSSNPLVKSCPPLTFNPPVPTSHGLNRPEQAVTRLDQIHFHCNFCSFSASEVLSLPVHMEAEHLSFTRQVSLRLQAQPDHLNKEYVCGECGQALQGTMTILQHLLAHDTDTDSLHLANYLELNREGSAKLNASKQNSNTIPDGSFHSSYPKSSLGYKATSLLARGCLNSPLSSGFTDLPSSLTGLVNKTASPLLKDNKSATKFPSVVLRSSTANSKLESSADCDRNCNLANVAIDNSGSTSSDTASDVSVNPSKAACSESCSSKNLSQEDKKRLVDLQKWCPEMVPVVTKSMKLSVDPKSASKLATEDLFNKVTNRVLDLMSEPKEHDDSVPSIIKSVQSSAASSVPDNAENNSVEDCMTEVKEEKGSESEDAKPEPGLDFLQNGCDGIPKDTDSDEVPMFDRKNERISWFKRDSSLLSDSNCVPITNEELNPFGLLTKDVFKDKNIEVLNVRWITEGLLVDSKDGKGWKVVTSNRIVLDDPETDSSSVQWKNKWSKSLAGRGEENNYPYTRYVKPFSQKLANHSSAPLQSCANRVETTGDMQPLSSDSTDLCRPKRTDPLEFIDGSYGFANGLTNSLVDIHKSIGSENFLLQMGRGSGSSLLGSQLGTSEVAEEASSELTINDAEQPSFELGSENTEGTLCDQSSEMTSLGVDMLQVEVDPLALLACALEEDQKSSNPVIPTEHFLLKKDADYSDGYPYAGDDFGDGFDADSHGYNDPDIPHPFYGYHNSSNFMSETTLDAEAMAAYHESSSTAGVFQCDICSKAFKYQYLLLSHRRQVHAIVAKPSSGYSSYSKRQQYTDVEDRGDANEDESSLVVDMSRIHPSLKSKMSTGLVINGQVFCPICGKKFVDRASLIAHSVMHLEKTARCQSCGLEFGSKSELTVHIVKFQGTCDPSKSGRVKCATCGEQCLSLQALKEHRRAMHPSPQLHRRDSTASQEGLTTTSDAPLPPGGSSPGSPVIPRRGFQCDYCGKNFNCRSNLRDHLVVHTGEKPYPCDICGKTFSFVHNMKTHRLTHNQGRHELCPYCSKSYKSKISLYYHMKKGNCRGLSTTEVPEGYHRCPDCLQMFASEERFSSHKQRGHCHTSHRCHHCGLRCSSQQRLDNHLKRGLCKKDPKMHGNSIQKRKRKEKFGALRYPALQGHRMPGLSPAASRGSVSSSCGRPPGPSSSGTSAVSTDDILCERCNYNRDCCCTFNCPACGKRVFSILAYTHHKQRTCPVVKLRREKVRSALLEKKRLAALDSKSDDSILKVDRMKTASGESEEDDEDVQNFNLSNFSNLGSSVLGYDASIVDAAVDDDGDYSRWPNKDIVDDDGSCPVRNTHTSDNDCSEFEAKKVFLQRNSLREFAGKSKSSDEVNSKLDVSAVENKLTNVNSNLHSKNIFTSKLSSSTKLSSPSSLLTSSLSYNVKNKVPSNVVTKSSSKSSENSAEDVNELNSKSATERLVSDSALSKNIHSSMDRDSSPDSSVLSASGRRIKKPRKFIEGAECSEIAAACCKRPTDSALVSRSSNAGMIKQKNRTIAVPSPKSAAGATTEISSSVSAATSAPVSTSKSVPLLTANNAADNATISTGARTIILNGKTLYVKPASAALSATAVSSGAQVSNLVLSSSATPTVLRLAPASMVSKGGKIIRLPKQILTTLGSGTKLIASSNAQTDAARMLNTTTVPAAMNRTTTVPAAVNLTNTVPATMNRLLTISSTSSPSSTASPVILNTMGGQQHLIVSGQPQQTLLIPQGFVIQASATSPAAAESVGHQ